MSRMFKADSPLLVVDDNPAFVDNLREVLGDAGYAVTGAGSCAEALHSVGATCLAIVDLRLPDGNGIELAQQLKARHSDCEVILLTGDASTASAAQAVRAGAFAYLVKPISPPDLLLTVEQARAKVALAAERRDLMLRTSRAEKLAAIGTLAAGLSHEIRNPLNAAALQLTVLRRRLAKIPSIPESTFEPLLLVQHEIARLSTFLDEFLQYAHPRELHLVPVDAGALVDQVLNLLQPQAAEHELRIERLLEPDVRILADESRLQQVVMNLVLNAIQATPVGGWIRIELNADRDRAQVVCEDSGPGVPEALRERIFEPFFTTKRAGSGLGLPMVHAIALQHGGSIRYEVGEKGGARFVLSLPLDPAGERTSAQGLHSTRPPR